MPPPDDQDGGSASTAAAAAAAAAATSVVVVVVVAEAAAPAAAADDDIEGTGPVIPCPPYSSLNGPDIRCCTYVHGPVLLSYVSIKVRQEYRSELNVLLVVVISREEVSTPRINNMRELCVRLTI